MYLPGKVGGGGNIHNISIHHVLHIYFVPQTSDGGGAHHTHSVSALLVLVLSEL